MPVTSQERTSLTSSFVIRMPVTSQESELTCICVERIDSSSLYDFDIRFWNCSDSVWFFLHVITTPHQNSVI
jgi:hypothetical protein